MIQPPNAQHHRPDPRYLRALVDRIGLSQEQCAFVIGVSPRAMRGYLRVPIPDRQAPYSVQYALEVWAQIRGAPL